jgi:hypothetical protein
VGLDSRTHFIRPDGRDYSNWLENLRVFLENYRKLKHAKHCYKILEKLDGEVGGIVADGDQVVGADADDGDVAGVVIHGEEKTFLGIEAQR